MKKLKLNGNFMGCVIEFKGWDNYERWSFFHPTHAAMGHIDTELSGLYEPN